MDKETRDLLHKDDRKEEAQQLIKSLQGLINHPGWEFMKSLAENQIKHRRDLITLVPTKDAMEQEFMKGECHGIMAFMKIPENFVAGAKEILELYKMKEDSE